MGIIISFLDELIMPLSTEAISELKKNLSQISDQLPIAAISEAVNHQVAVTPMLLEALKAVKIRGKCSSSSTKSRLALHALYLLTQFREPQAWPAAIELFSSMSTEDNIPIGDNFDEVVCDHLSQIFATLCSG
ncbi:MAG: DUF1186 domain-containing protein, partial [Endozoicomonas sp.]